MNITGWVIVIAQGRTLIGKPSTEGGRLSPVYDLQVAMQFVQQDPRQPPQLMVLRQVQPFLTYPSLRAVDIVSNAICVPVSELTCKEQRELEKQIEACEQMIQAMRAQESGLLLVPPGTKVRQ